MTTLGATLPDADAARAYALVDQAARALVSADRDCGCGPVRSLPQARADALVDLVLGDRLGDSREGDGALPRRPARPKALVTVTVPLASLLGEAHDGTPGDLGWIGSVLPESARQIALGALREMSGSGFAGSLSTTAAAPWPSPARRTRPRPCCAPRWTRGTSDAGSRRAHGRGAL